MRRSRIAALFLPLAVTACSFAPDHVRPPLPVPIAYAENVPTGTSIAGSDWRDFFTDAELQRLIETALASNRDLRIATARLDQARAAWRIEGTPLYPQIDAVGTGSRGRTLYALPGAGAAAVDIRQISAQLSASWQIDFWGQIRNLRDAARWRYLATEEARRAVATEIVAQVANGYLLEREYEERVALARSSIATREESLRIMRRRYEVGSGSKLDMTQAQTLLAQARTTLQALEQDRAVNRHALALLVGEAVVIRPAPSGLAVVKTHVSLPPGLPSELLVNRPDIIAAEHELRAASADIGAARAAFFPNISLTGGYGTMSTALDGLFGKGTEAWNFTPTIVQPIFNAGRLQANLDVAKARRAEAVASYEKAIQSAFRDVSDALTRKQQLDLQITTTSEMLNALQERARLAQLRFDYGRSAYLEVLDAQRDLFDAEQSLARLRRAEIASVVALYAALGGGFAAQSNARDRPTQDSGKLMP